MSINTGRNKAAVLSLVPLLAVTEKSSSVLESRMNSGIYSCLHSSKLAILQGQDDGDVVKDVVKD